MPSGLADRCPVAPPVLVERRNRRRARRNEGRDDQGVPGRVAERWPRLVGRPPRDPVAQRTRERAAVPAGATSTMIRPSSTCWTVSSPA
jgi:hypothetical protein